MDEKEKNITSEGTEIDKLEETEKTEDECASKEDETSIGFSDKSSEDEKPEEDSASDEEQDMEDIPYAEVRPVEENNKKVPKWKKKKSEPEEEPEDDEYDEYEDDDDEYDDDDEEDNKGKIIIISILIAIVIAAASIFVYQKLKADSDAQSQSEAQTEVVTSESELSSEEESETVSVTEVETESETPAPTSTPKPVPSATPTPTPFPDDTSTEDSATDYDGSDYDIDIDDNTPEDTDVTIDSAEPASIIFLGDSRFREMANVVTGDAVLWECSATGNYSWMTDTAYPDVDSRIGTGTKILINIGINDLDMYQSYASSINAKAKEWKEKGASVYYVSVGPVAKDSMISNQQIADFNTYMFQNLDKEVVPFIDAYNYLVENGFSTNDGQVYDSATNISLYGYLTGLVE